jgi:hypothetical protein
MADEPPLVAFAGGIRGILTPVGIRPSAIMPSAHLLASVEAYSLNDPAGKIVLGLELSCQEINTLSLG